jgi:ubiquinone/menaquinone biosynthesis C-methylase UbiE
MRCPRCAGKELLQNQNGFMCLHCSSQYAVRNGVLDMMGDDTKEVITPFQRLMQTRIIVFVYEKIWRRIGYWLASSRSFKEEMQTVLQFAAGRNTDRTMDLACGPGVFTRPLAHGSQGLVVGLDMSRPMLARAHKLVRKGRIENIVLIRASAFAMPFMDGAFQYINCCGALHLFDRPEVALKEIARVLAPGGHLCVQTTIRPVRSAGFAYILEKFIRFGFFEEAELKDLLARNGFRILDCQRHRISFTFLAGCA